MKSKYISDYVYLAEASYTYFSKDEKAFDSLTDKDNENLPESFAKLFTDN